MFAGEYWTAFFILFFCFPSSLNIANLLMAHINFQFFFSGRECLPQPELQQTLFFLPLASHPFKHAQLARLCVFNQHYPAPNLHPPQRLSAVYPTVEKPIPFSCLEPMQSIQLQSIQCSTLSRGSIYIHVAAVKITNNQMHFNIQYKTTAASGMHLIHMVFVYACLCTK